MQQPIKINATSVIIPVLEKDLKALKTKLFPDLNLELFTANENEFFSLEYQAKNYFLVGLGESSSYEKLQKIAKKFSWQQKDKLNQQANGLYFSESFDNQQIQAFLLGLFTGAYRIIKSKEDTNKHPFWHNNTALELVAKNPKSNATNALNKANEIAKAQFVAMDWLNKSPNHKTSEMIGDYLKDLAKELGVESTILNKKQCKEIGLNAFLAVNQGSAYEPAFCILEYKGKNAQKKVGLIGKCVTFDTGGISIKPSQNMHYMKSDMGGATASLGAFIAAVKLQLPVHLVLMIPATDNAVSNKAYLPGDVIESYSGKTIEVINTDAEGRMTLADAISYMEKIHQPDLMLDIATLTGSAVRTFGYVCAALLTENKDLEQLITEAGEYVGQKSWPLPLWDEYLENLKSDVADLKHISHQPMSDAIHAGKFLQQFTNNHNNWAHLDIAGVAFGKNDYADDKSATGYGVQLIVEILQRYVS